MDIDRYLLTFLLNSLWQIPLAAGVAALICRGMRYSPAQHRHLVWVAALAAALLLPAASVRRWASPSPTLAVPQSSLSEAAAVATASEAAAPRRIQQAARPEVPVARNIAGLAFAAYLALLVFRLIWLARAGVRTIGIRRQARTAQLPLIDRIRERCEAALGARAEMLSSASIAGPANAGARIILPEDMLSEPSEEILITAIGHEMAHVKRRDFAWNLLYEVLHLLIAFHPAAWWIRREIARTRELACDEMVAGRLLAPRAYAESLVRIARGIAEPRLPGYALGVFDGNILEVRVRHLLDRRRGSLRRARLMLAAGLSALAVCAAIGLGLAISARAQSVAQPEIKVGVEAFNRHDFPRAVEHFERAVNLDPDYLNARLHLANALIRDHMANAPKTADESAPAPRLERARQQYEEVLRRDAKHVAAMFGIAALNGPSRARESRELMMKIIAIDPKNMDAYYSAAVIDWQMAYPSITKAKAAPEDPQIADPALRARLRQEWTPYIEEGLRLLQIALAQSPNRPDAMAYMSLLLRAGAAVSETSEEAMTLNAQSDEWVAKSIASRRFRAKSPETAATLHEDEPPPMAVLDFAPPPPPPPPPPGHHREAPPPPPPPPPKR